MIEILCLLISSVLAPLFVSIATKVINSGPRGTIFGVIGAKVPRELSLFRDYTNYRLAYRSKGPCVLHCKTLSFALRKCDFVVYDSADDPKMVNPDDHVTLQDLVDGVSKG